MSFLKSVGHVYLDPGGFAPAAPLRRRSRGPHCPAPLRRGAPVARLVWYAARAARNEYKIVVSSRMTAYLIRLLYAAASRSASASVAWLGRRRIIHVSCGFALTASG
jgi:hypothetical protein